MPPTKLVSHLDLRELVILLPEAKLGLAQISVLPSRRRNSAPSTSHHPSSHSSHKNLALALSSSQTSPLPILGETPRNSEINQHQQALCKEQGLIYSATGGRGELGA